MMRTPSLFHSKNKIAAVLSLFLITPVLSMNLTAQTVWNDQAASLISDIRAHEIGDILTVIIQENKTASKNTSTKSTKKSGVDAGIEAFLFSPSASGLLTKNGQLPSMKLNSSTQFEGGGNVSSTEKITTRLSVRILDVLPNRQYLIEGVQKTSFGGESQDVVLRGVVREADITSGNTVFSYNLADVTIQFSSKGALSDKTKRGWFTKAWDKINPF